MACQELPAPLLAAFGITCSTAATAASPSSISPATTTPSSRPSLTAALGFPLGYCPMPHHFHLLIRSQDDGDLGRWVLASSIHPSIDPAKAVKSSQVGCQFLQCLVESTGGFHVFGTIQSLKPERILDSILKSDA